MQKMITLEDLVDDAWNEVLKHLDKEDTNGIKKVSCVSRQLYDKTSKFQQSAYGKIVYFRDFIQEKHKSLEKEISAYQQSYRAGFFRPGQSNMSQKVGYISWNLFYFGSI